VSIIVQPHGRMTVRPAAAAGRANAPMLKAIRQVTRRILAAEG